MMESPQNGVNDTLDDTLQNEISLFVVDAFLG